MADDLLGGAERNGSAAIRVLIAEDDAAVRQLLVELVRCQPGLRLAAAACDTETAVAAAAAELPDVAVVDVQMPGGGGLRAVREIAECSPKTRVIAFSGDDEGGTVQEMLDAGAHSYVVKGSSLAAIVDAIERAGKVKPV